MSEALFNGVITALVTPFCEGAVDDEALVALVERQVAAGVQGLAPVGTTGETATLTMAEHMHVVRTCVEVVNGRVPVLAGAGSNSTAEALELARHAEAVGADGVLVVTPYYNRPSQEGLYRHYAALSQGMGLPIIVYNVPGRTSVDLAHETVVRLSHLPHVRGVKDATGDLARVSLMRLDCASGFRLFSGDDPSALGYVAQGGHGLISVTSNVAPEACVQRLAAALTGDRAAALAWQDKLIKLDRALFLDASPGPTKFALSQLGLCREEVRLPLSAVLGDRQTADPSSHAPCRAAVMAAAEGRSLIAENRRARFDYFLEETLEAGISLTGTEVKALREGRANIAESYASAEGRELVLINAYIPEYANANRFNHEPRRPRKLLLKRKQIDRLIGAVQRDGRTIVPVRLYWNDKGRAKLELALAKGKKLHDKRQTEADRDWARDKARLMRDKG